MKVITGFLFVYEWVDMLSGAPAAVVDVDPGHTVAQRSVYLHVPGDVVAIAATSVRGPVQVL